MDSFYGQGTWDLRLVEVRFKYGGTLVPSFDLQSIEDNSGYESPSDDLPENAFRNPYRAHECVGLVDDIVDFQSACTLEDKGFVARDDDGEAKWPCPSDDLKTLGCSLEAIPRSWTFPGWAVRDQAYWIASGYLLDPPFRLLPLATPEAFRALFPKPTLAYDWSAAPLQGVRRVGLRQRQMAYMDATMKEARVCWVRSTVPECETATFVQGTSAPYVVPNNGDSIEFGRAGRADEVVVDLGETVDIKSLSITVTEVFAYSPPADMLAPDEWGVTPLEETFVGFYDYVQPTMGTWNVGFTYVSLYDEYNTKLPRPNVMQAVATSTGKFDDFNETFPLENAYKPYDSAVNDTKVLDSWCWHGHFVLNGKEPDYAFVSSSAPSSSPPPSPPPSPPGQPSGTGEGEGEPVG